MSKPLAILSISALLALLVVALGREVFSEYGIKKYGRRVVMMGDVEVRVTVVAGRRSESDSFEAMEKALAEGRRIEALVSEFQPTSETTRLNQSAGGPPIAIGRELKEILELAAEVSEKTNGAFDITFASKDPSISWRDVWFDRRHKKASLAKGVKIGLSGIAKGYIVDRMAEILRRQRFKNFLIDAGGDLIAVGEDVNGPWKVGIADPAHPRGPPLCHLSLKNEAAATSGTYERGPHIVDPRKKKPVAPLASATVLAPTAALADALATGFFVLGEKGPKLFPPSGADGLLLITRSGKRITVGPEGYWGDCRHAGRR